MYFSSWFFIFGKRKRHTDFSFPCALGSWYSAPTEFKSLNCGEIAILYLHFCISIFRSKKRKKPWKIKAFCGDIFFIALWWLRRWDLNLTTSGLWARRATRLLYSAILESWCRKRESNPYDALASRDFKSRASTNSATPAFRLFNAHILYHFISFLSILFWKLFQKFYFSLFCFSYWH